MEACCLRIFLVAAVSLLVVQAERDNNPNEFQKKVDEAEKAGELKPDDPTAVDLDNAAESIQVTGDKNFEAATKLLRPPALYDDDEGGIKTGGELYELWQGFEQLRQDALKTARSWSQNTYEAMKEAHQDLAKPLHYTKNALMRDAMRVNHAIRGEFKDHMAMIDTIALDAHARNQIRSEYGQSVMIPPDEFGEDLKHRRVRCNTRYQGRDANKVHQYPLGEITGFEKGSDAYRIQFDKTQWGKDTKNAPTRDYYLLRKGEFVLLPGRVSGGNNDYTNDLFNTNPVERVNNMASKLGENGFYELHPYVVVDNGPDGDSPSESWKGVASGTLSKWIGALAKSSICKVVKVDKTNKKFVIAFAKNADAAIPYDQREYDAENTVELTAGLDFHTFSSVKDDRVRFNYAGPKEDKARTTANNVEGRVISFNPAKMSYTIAVPEFEVPMNNVSRMDKKAQDWTKSGSSVPSKFDKPYVGKHIKMMQSNHWVPGRISGFYPKKDKPVLLSDYLYDLLPESDTIPQTGKEWGTDWRELAGHSMVNDKEYVLHQAEWEGYKMAIWAKINQRLKDNGIAKEDGSGAYDFAGDKEDGAAEAERFAKDYEVVVVSDKDGTRRKWSQLEDHKEWFPITMTIKSNKEGMTLSRVHEHQVRRHNKEAKTKFEDKYIRGIEPKSMDDLDDVLLS